MFSLNRLTAVLVTVAILTTGTLANTKAAHDTHQFKPTIDPLVFQSCENKGRKVLH